MSPVGERGHMQVGEGWSARSIRWTREYWNGLEVAALGCGDDGKLEPAETEFALRLPPVPLLEPVCGEVSCGGVLMDQMRMVPSAAPDASIVRSGPPWWAEVSPNIDPEVPGRTQIVHTASVCPSNVVFGSTLPLSHIRTVAS